MGKISRRAFLAAGAAAAAVPGSLMGMKGNRAMAYDYTPPAEIPFSKEREAYNQIIAKAKKPQVVKVRDGVFSAIGYALGNMIMVETPEGIIIIDTTENRKVAQAIMGEFRKITDKPLKGIIYTHYHGDHIQGTKVFFEPGTPVYAHENFMKEFKLHASRGKTAAMRAGAMFGLIMPSERIPMVTAFPVPGGSHLMWEVLKPEDFVWPTVTFRDKHSFRLGGLTFNLFHAPGETPDQIMVDVPELQFVCCADNYYASFPNLYTIRGTSYRPVMDWATAQDKVIALEPEFLVPCHGAPIQGKAVIKEVLGNYRDAILHVHNAVLKGIQNGNSIESIIATAALPPNLAGLPYLQPYYGCIPYSARAIYDSYVGWFDGNPANLSPLSRKELGAELLEMMGSTDKILVHAEKALKVQKYQAALEFCDMVLGNDPKNKPARLMKITALTGLSNASSNMPTANYYKASALMEKKHLENSG